jgi:hypothetical protein
MVLADTLASVGGSLAQGPVRNQTLACLSSDQITPRPVASAGHDRCIINLRPEHVEAWLTPEKRGREELQAILLDRAVSAFEHAALMVA